MRLAWLFLPFSFVACAAPDASDEPRPADEVEETADELRKSNYWNESSCSGPALTQAQLLRYFAPGSLEAGRIGTLRTFNRMRTCTRLTGCSKWTEQQREGLQYDSYSASVATSLPVALEIKQWHGESPSIPVLTILEHRSSFLWMEIDCRLDGVDALECKPQGVPMNVAFGDPAKKIGAFRMKATTSCLRVELDSEPDHVHDEWTEGETVLFAKLRQPR